LSYLVACASQPTLAFGPTVAKSNLHYPEDGGQTAAEPEPADMAVRASLESSAGALSPNGRFLLAIRFDIPEGYRVSWINPGDMGREPVIEFNAPESFEVSPPMFPGPKRFELPNGAVSYGYDQSTAVFVEVRTPDQVDRGEFYRFDVNASWFSCKKQCMKESVEAYFELEASDDPIEQGLARPLQAAWETVPKPLESFEAARAEWRSESVLVVHADGMKWKDFFPGSAELPPLRRLSIDDTNNDLVLEFEGGTPGGLVEGVAVADIDGRLAYVSISKPWPTQAN
jgi:DsbC/DsbD-like thiol-disulfide interchange protein